MPATPGKKSGRQDPQTPKDASIELRDFMYEMESSAKKILIKSNKRRMDEALMAEKAALISSTKKKNKQLDSSLDTSMAMSSSMNNANAQTVVLQIPNGMKAHGMASTAKYGFTPSPMSTMKIDRPSLSVTVSDNEMIQESPIKKRQINFDGTNKLKSAANNLPNVSTPTSGKVLPPPPRLSMKFPPPNPIGTPTTPIGGKNAGRGGKGGATPSPSPQKGGIHKNLHASPLFSRTMGDSEKSRLAEANTLRLQASVGAAGSTEVENDDVEEINVSRGIGSIMASKNKHGKKGKHQAKLAKAQAQKKAGIAMPAKMELQGPISWASDDLRIKYRCEMRRFQAYESYLSASEEAKVLEREDGIVVSVPSVENHPIYKLFRKLIDLETTRASNRARARNGMRRFVLDVHTVWITNLAHLREHAIDEQPITTPKSRGLKNRRDVQSIETVSSQIQSVAISRTLDDASNLITVMEEETNEMRADFEANKKNLIHENVKDPPKLSKPYVPPPEYWTLVRGEQRSVNVVEDESNSYVRPHRIFVSRLRRRDGSKPLWSVSAYDVEDGEEFTTVLDEDTVFSIVGKARALEGGGENSTVKNSNNNTITPTPTSTSTSTPTQTLVHKQGVRLQCGDSMIPALASVFVWPSGPHIRVLIKLHLRGRAPWQESSPETFDPPATFHLETTTYEIVARLKLQSVLSALDLHFWNSNGNSNSDIWRKVVDMLVCDKWAPPPKPQQQLLGDNDNENENDEEKKSEELVLTKTKSKKKKRKKKREEEGGDSSTTTATATATSTTTQKVFNGTIPCRAMFAPTPHHDESDLTITIGGESLFDADADVDADTEAGGELSGLSDFYAAVAVGYELMNNLSVNRGGLIVGSKSSSAVVKLTEAERGGEGWLQEFNNVPSLSMRASGRIGFHQLCPGTVSIGKKGLWFKHNRREGDTAKGNLDQENSLEVTRAVASYLRDPNLSSSMSVIVNCLLALESPLLAPLLMAWEPRSANPPPAPHMEVDCIVPMFMSRATTLLTHPVESELDVRNATPILCLTLAEKEEDFSKRAAHGQKDAHRRRLETSNANFFRCKVSTALLHPDDVIPKYVFGVTQQGASCNNTGVNGRNMWHSEQRCVEQLCRVRGPADFISVMRSAFTDCNGGAHNMANVYVMKMYGYKLDELAKGGEKDFNERYEKVKRNREAKAKAEALSAKIEAGKLLLEKKQAALELMVRQEGLKKLQEQGRGGGKGKGEGLTSRAWQKRVKRSVTLSFQEVGTQGWEQRLDPKHNQVFYHNTDPYVTAQLGNCWDPPMDWDETLDEILRPDASTSRAESRSGVVSRALNEGSGDGGGEDEEAGMGMGRTGTAKTGTGGFRLGTSNSKSGLGLGLGLAMLDDDVESTGSEMERMVDSLASNDDFVRMIAYKLGVPEAQIRGIDRDVPLNPREDETSRSEQFRGDADAVTNAVSLAGETELGDDDDGWSDSDDEVGGVGELREDPKDEMFPQDHVDNRSDFVKERNEQFAIDGEFVQEEQEWKAVEDGGVKKTEVPRLAIEGKINQVAPIESLEAHVGVRGYGWRRLGKEKVPDGKNFFKMGEHKIQKCTGDFYNKPNKPFMVGMLDPKEVLNFENDESGFNEIKMESLFVKNCLDDMDRVVKMTEVRMKREKMLLDENVNSLKDIIDLQPSEFTTVDQLMAGDQAGGDGDDAASNDVHKAILSVKNSNFDSLESVLDEGVQIDTRDEYGNTLLILSCQQGNKRMAKFLLRRGATINAQNNLGNTLLHYLHEYGKVELFDYMKAKGCNDSFVNADGCTCYEGLKKDAVDNI